MKKMNKKSKEGIKRKIASFSLVAMLLNAVMAGVFIPGEEVLADEDQMCEAAVDVVMIIDRSGSMSPTRPPYEDRIGDAQNAANSFLGYLGGNDQSALVSYASEATLDKGLSNTHSTVSGLTASGGTNIGDAIYLSNTELGSPEANPQAVKVAILLTDGRPTCPHFKDPLTSCGFVEDDEDIQYALDAANVAAIAGYKIFTIGLGSDINTDMLEDIAEITGAEYHHAPTSTDLEGIYNSIRLQLCQYSSISGYKYNDTNNDSDINGEPIIAGWEINISGDASDTQSTDVNGYYTFAGLEPGTYTITETIPAGSDWVQTYRPDPNEFVINWGDNLTDKDFGNYLPECGNGILDDDEDCDDGNIDDGDGCSSNCLFEETEPVCGNSILEGDEQCDFGEDNNGEDGSACDDNCQLIQPIEECVEPLILEDVDPIDSVDIGNTADEAGHDLAGWTASNLEDPTSPFALGNYGGHSDDGSHRQVWEETCRESTNAATLILRAGSNKATKLKIDALDGQSDRDNFDVYINGKFLAHYTDVQDGIEVWHTEEYPLDNLTGDLIVAFRVTGDAWESCNTYGQLAISSVEISGYECLAQESDCGDGVVEGNEECDDGEGYNGDGAYCSSQCTINPECNNGIDDDGDGDIDYSDDPGCDSAEDNDEYNEPASYCGDGVCNNNETCSTCPQDCGACSTGGGGGGWISPIVIKITDEKVSYLGEGKALVSWKTNVTTTNQVVYGDDSKEEENLGNAPEYGYDSVNEESGSMWKEHEVMIIGLMDGITYYFRPVADRNGSEEVIGEEVSYVFEEEGEVKGVTDPPAPVECNYLLEYIKLGADNNPVEVEKLERFLNEFEGENLPINGIYEQADFDAVSKFQEKYLESVLSPWSHNKATGYVYITTKKKINEIYCQKVFPLTAEQEAEVASFAEKFLDMFAGSAEASGDSGEEDLTPEDTVESSETEDEKDVSGKVGGVQDEVEEGENEITEDKTTEEIGNGTEEKDETKEEDKTAEDENADTDADTTEETKDESEVAGTEYTEYLLWLAALIIIAGIAWYYWPKKKTDSE